MDHTYRYTFNHGMILLVIGGGWVAHVKIVSAPVKKIGLGIGLGLGLDNYRVTIKERYKV